MNQIIERGLHASDDEIKLYTTNLVDKLEQVGSLSPSPLSPPGIAFFPGSSGPGANLSSLKARIRKTTQ